MGPSPGLALIVVRLSYKLNQNNTVYLSIKAKERDSQPINFKKAIKLNCMSLFVWIKQEWKKPIKAILNVKS